MRVHETPFDQPDVSEIAPVSVSQGRSNNYLVVHINEYKKYVRDWLYWDDIEKTWRYSSNGNPCTNEMVRIDEALQ